MRPLMLPLVLLGMAFVFLIWSFGVRSDASHQLQRDIDRHDQCRQLVANILANRNEPIGETSLLVRLSKDPGTVLANAPQVVDSSVIASNEIDENEKVWQKLSVAESSVSIRDKPLTTREVWSMIEKVGTCNIFPVRLTLTQSEITPDVDRWIVQDFTFQQITTASDP